MLEGVVVEGGGVQGKRRRALLPRPGESAGNPSRAGVKLQDEQLRLRGGQVRGWRRGIQVTWLAKGVVDGGGVGEEDEDTFTAGPPRRTEFRGGRARIRGAPTPAVDAAQATARKGAERWRGAAHERGTLAITSDGRKGRK